MYHKAYSSTSFPLLILVHVLSLNLVLAFLKLNYPHLHDRSITNNYLPLPEAASLKSRSLNIWYGQGQVSFSSILPSHLCKIRVPAIYRYRCSVIGLDSWCYKLLIASTDQVFNLRDALPWLSPNEFDHPHDGAADISKRKTLANAPDRIRIDAVEVFGVPSSELASSSWIYRASSKPKDSFGIRRQHKDHLSSKC
jgi:hypothetical protein